MPLTLPAAPVRTPSLANPGTFEEDTSNYLAWQAAIATAMRGTVNVAGDFGIGQSGNIQQNILLNSATTSGIYQFSPDDPNTPIITGGAVLIVRYASSWINQTVYAPNSNSQWFRRTQDNGVVWSAWVPLIARRIVNSNGIAVQQADGTMICTSREIASGNVATASGSLFQGATQTWVYPAPFVAAPAVGGGAGDIGRFLTISAPAITNVTFRFNAAASSTLSTNARLTAVGSWI